MSLPKTFSFKDVVKSIRKRGTEPVKLASLEESDEEPISIDMILSASQKVLNVNRGLQDTDERDALSFKKIYNVNDLISERVRFDSGKLGTKLMRKLNRNRSLKNIPSGLFNGYAEKQIISNPLTQASEEINPLHIREQLFRITQMGPGGIGSEQAITEEMQNVHNSEFGFIDPISGPESSRAGIDTRMAFGSKLGSDGKIYQRFLNPKTGNYHWLSATDLEDKVIGFPEELS